MDWGGGRESRVDLVQNLLIFSLHYSTPLHSLSFSTPSPSPLHPNRPLRIWEQGLWWVWDYKIIISWTYLFYWNWENMMEEQIWALEFFVVWTVRIGSIYVVYFECMTRTLPHWCLWVRQEQSLKVSIYSPHIKLFYIIFLSCLDFLHFLKKKFRFSSSIVSFLYMSLYCKIKWTLKLCKFLV